MKLPTRLPRLVRQLNEARSMLDDEKGIAKLLGMHDRLFASNTELVKIYGEFAPRVTAAGTRLEALVQHNDLAIEMLAELRSKMFSLEPRLQRLLQAPVAGIIPLPQGISGGPRLLPFQSTRTRVPIGAELREGHTAAESPANAPGIVYFYTESVVLSTREKLGAKNSQACISGFRT